MAKIITFSAARTERRARPAPGGEGAEIVIFPGVFYEYLEEPRPSLTRRRLENGGTRSS